MASATQIQALYVAYFGRPADPAGFDFWTAGGDRSDLEQLEDQADLMSKSDEYLATTKDKTTAEIITGFYQNLFNRDPEPEGLEFWVNQVANGNTNIQDVGLYIGRAALEASVNDGESNSDQEAVLAKTAAANAFTVQVASSLGSTLAYSGPGAADIGRAYINPVVDKNTIPTAGSVLDAIGSLGSGGGVPNPGGVVPLSNDLALSVYTDIADSAGAKRFDPTGVIKTDPTYGQLVATPSFAFSSANQAVTGTFADVQSTDKLLDTTTTDTDTLTITDVTKVLEQASIDKIEEIKLTLKDFATGKLAGAAAGGTGLTITNGKKVTIDGTVTKDNTAQFDATDSGISDIDASNLTAAAGTAKTTITAAAGGTKITTGITLDTIIGKAGDDEIDGGAGADDIKGGGGTNTIKGGKGVDKFQMDGGVNTINDFALDKDVDTIIISVGAKATVNVVDDYVAAAAGDIDNNETTISDVNFVLADGKDFDASKADGTTAGLTITAAANKTTASTIVGTIKADNITGSEKNDTITGGDGSDSITGGLGADTISYVSKTSGGGATVAIGDNVMSAGDTVIGFVSGAANDNFGITAGSFTNASGKADAAKVAFNAVDTITNATFVVDASDLDFVGDTTKSSAVATAIGKVKGKKDDVTYVALEGDDGATFNVFQVTLAADRDGTAILQATDTIAHLAAFKTDATYDEFVATFTF